jgi:hypothetical protein
VLKMATASDVEPAANEEQPREELSGVVVAEPGKTEGAAPRSLHFGGAT